MKRLSIFGLAILLWGGLASGQSDPGVSGSVPPTNLTVAAAANLAPVAETLKAAFTAHHPGVGIDFVFGASGALTTQIQHGAPFQVFLSADVEFPQRLWDAGLATARPQIYARGKLILLSTQPREFSRGLGLLKDPAIVQFAMANPGIAPYGRAAQQALMNAGLWQLVKAKAVTGQTITQTLQFTLGAAGIGLVNQSALYTKELIRYRDQPGVYWLEVDAALHDPIDQALVVIRSEAVNPAAPAFAAFMAGKEAQQILLHAGYTAP